VVVTYCCNTKEEWETQNLCEFQKVKCSHKKDPYPLPFIDEVINSIVAGHDVYSLIDGYFNYHKIPLTLGDKYKTTFVIDWGTFPWLVILFGVKNGPPTY
jgi:hypothetical protein